MYKSGQQRKEDLIVTLREGNGNKGSNTQKTKQKQKKNMLNPNAEENECIDKGSKYLYMEGKRGPPRGVPNHAFTQIFFRFHAEENKAFHAITQNQTKNRSFT